MSREQLSKRKWLAELLCMHGEIVFNTHSYTVFLQESGSGFDYSLYKLGAKPDENGEFNEEKLIDGGVIEEVDYLNAISHMFEI